jgi:hypothetical protein
MIQPEDYPSQPTPRRRPAVFRSQPARRLWAAAFIAIGLAVAAVLASLLASGRAGRPSGTPALAFKGYSTRATNGEQIADFELRNTTTRAIWLCYSGGQGPLRAPFLERPINIPANTGDNKETNVWELNIGSFFITGKKVLPGRSVPLEFPLTPGTPTTQVGIDYYVGRFKDGNDFLGSIGTSLLDRNANLKRKAEYFWEKLQRSLKAPRRYEIWCQEPVCFQTSTANAPPAHSAQPQSGGGG